MHFSAKLVAATVLSTLLAGASAAQADDVSTLRQEAAALKKQNETLEKRLNKIENQQQFVQQQSSTVATPDFLAHAVTKGPADLLTGEGPLTWNGITVFGAIDAGLGYASAGLPSSSQLYAGSNQITKYARGSYFGISPNNMAQTTLGIKGVEEIMPGLAGVFMASTGFSPQSGQLANAPGSIVANNGKNPANFAISGDGSRDGQAINDQLYVGLASPTYGQLTFGRHRTFSLDVDIAYDPASGYAFSPIAYSGSPVAGLGDTATSRWNDSFKYRFEYGPVHAGAMYKFADGPSGSNDGLGGVVCPTSGTQPAAINGNACKASTLGGALSFPTNNYAYQFNLGGSYMALDVDGSFGYINQAVTVNNGQLTAAQLAGASTFISNTGLVTNSIGAANANTLGGVVSDNYATVIAAKYTWNQFKFYAGYSYVNYSNPSQNLGIGATSAQGGYIMSQVNNGAFPHNKILQTEWVGVRYAYDPKTDIAVAYYHEGQNQYASTATLKQGGCNTKSSQNLYSSACSGELQAVSFLVDHHFTKRFDAYAGMMVSNVNGGFASGYNLVTNWAPTVGLRYTF